MTEKNTLSILENIKKKMQKFDQEPKGIDTIASVNDEFEYISSSKAKAPEIKVEEPNLAESKIPDFIDQDLKSAVKSANMPLESEAKLEATVQTQNVVPNQNQASVVAAPSGNDTEEDFGDNLGLDEFDDVAKPQNNYATPASPAQVMPQNLAIENHDEFDDLKLDFDEEVPQKITEVAESKPAEVPASNDPFDDDFADLDLDKLLNEDSVSSQNVETVAKVEDKKVAEVKVQETKSAEIPASAKPIDEDQFLKDLGLEDLQSVKSEVKKTEVDKPNQSSDSFQKRMENISLEDLDVELGIKSKAQVTQQPIKEPEISAKEFLPEVKNPEVKNIASNSEFSGISEEVVRVKLQEWFDKNLPTLVERIVQEEVKKLFEKR